MCTEKSALSLQTGAELGELIAVMRAAHGFDVSRYDESFLTSSLARRRAATSHGTDAAYLECLQDGRSEAEALFLSLRVSHSEFFRDSLTFSLLERGILPALAESKARAGGGEIRVWSAGCAAGQEPWSVAILLDELSAARERSVPYRVFGTDVSERDLDAARTGVYCADAVGNVRLRHLRDSFSRQGESFSIAPRLRERVDFSAYDLLDESTTSPPASIWGDIDLVLCCNVLLYYRPEWQRFIIDKARGCLAPGGYLITGETERQIVARAGGFRAANFAAPVFQRLQRRRGPCA